MVKYDLTCLNKMVLLQPRDILPVQSVTAVSKTLSHPRSCTFNQHPSGKFEARQEYRNAAKYEVMQEMWKGETDNTKLSNKHPS